MTSGMTELEIIDAIGAEVRSHEKATSRALGLVEKGLELYPQSPRLWMVRGDLIKFSDDDDRYSLEDALESYRTALRLEPDNTEAHESRGHYFDVVADSPKEAEPYFRKAIAPGGGKSAPDGLAQVLEQLGRSE